MTTKILADSQICISVPLNVLFLFIFAFYQKKKKKTVYGLIYGFRIPLQLGFLKNNLKALGNEL